MLRFENSDYLWGLLLVPCFALLFWAVARWKKRAFAALGDKHVTQNMVPEVAFLRPRLKFVFFAAAYALLVVAAAGPQLGAQIEEESKKGADLMILLDVS